MEACEIFFCILYVTANSEARNREFAQRVTMHKHACLRVLTPHDAENFFSRRLPRDMGRNFLRSCEGYRGVINAAAAWLGIGGRGQKSAANARKSKTSARAGKTANNRTGSARGGVAFQQDRARRANRCATGSTQAPGGNNKRELYSQCSKPAERVLPKRLCARERAMAGAAADSGQQPATSK